MYFLFLLVLKTTWGAQPEVAIGFYSSSKITMYENVDLYTLILLSLQAASRKMTYDKEFDINDEAIEKLIAITGIWCNKGKYKSIEGKGMRIKSKLLKTSIDNADMDDEIYYIASFLSLPFFCCSYFVANIWPERQLDHAKMYEGILSFRMALFTYLVNVAVDCDIPA